MKKKLNFKEFIKSKLGENFTFSNESFKVVKNIKHVPFDAHEEVIEVNGVDMYPDNYLCFGGEIARHLSRVEFQDLEHLWLNEIAVARVNGSEILFGFSEDIQKNLIRQLDIGEVIIMNTKRFLVNAVYCIDNRISYRIKDEVLGFSSIIFDDDLRKMNFVSTGASVLHHMLNTVPLPVTIRSNNTVETDLIVIEKILDSNLVIYKTSTGKVLRDIDLDFIDNVFYIKYNDFDVKLRQHRSRSEYISDSKTRDFYRYLKEQTDNTISSILSQTPDFLNEEQINMFKPLVNATETIDLTPPERKSFSFGDTIVLGTDLILDDVEYKCIGIKHIKFINKLIYTLYDRKTTLRVEQTEDFLLNAFNSGRLHIENNIFKIENIVLPIEIGPDTVFEKKLDDLGNPMYSTLNRDYSLHEIKKYLCPNETKQNEDLKHTIGDNGQLLKLFDIIDLPMGRYTCTSITFENDKIFYYLDTHDYDDSFETKFDNDSLIKLEYKIVGKTRYEQLPINSEIELSDGKHIIIAINKDFTYHLDNDCCCRFDEIHNNGLEDVLCLEKLTIDNISNARKILKTDVPIIIDKFSSDNDTIYTIDNDYTYSNCYILEHKDR